MNPLHAVAQRGSGGGPVEVQQVQRTIGPTDRPTDPHIAESDPAGPSDRPPLETTEATAAGDAGGIHDDSDVSASISEEGGYEGSGTKKSGRAAQVIGLAEV